MAEGDGSGRPWRRYVVVVAALAVSMTAQCSSDGKDEQSTTLAPQRLSRSVAAVQSFVGDDLTASRSGFRLGSSRRDLYTASDLAAKGGLLRVSNAAGKSVRAGLVAVAPCEGVALLRLRDDLSLSSLAPRTERVRVEEQVAMAGFRRLGASGRRLEIVDSVVTSSGTPVGPFVEALRVDALPPRGFSGGPALDTRGRVVGMNTAYVPVEQPGEEAVLVGIQRLRAIAAHPERGRSPESLGMLLDFGVDTRELGFPPGVIAVGAIPGTSTARMGLPLPALVVSVGGVAMDRGRKGYCDVVRADRGRVSVVVRTLRTSSSEGERDVTLGPRQEFVVPRQ